MVEDAIFLLAYLWLQRRGAKTVFALMSDFYFLALLVAISALLVSIMMSSDPSIRFLLF